MDLGEMITALQLELADEAGIAWNDEELERAITKAVADMDRFFPLEKYLDMTLIFEVDDEHWAYKSSIGVTNCDVWVELNYKPLKWNSETVENPSGVAVTYTRDTDYYMDYANGKIYLHGMKFPNGKGDFDGDGFVTKEDFDTFEANIATWYGLPVGTDPDMIMADLDDDGTITALDYAAWFVYASGIHVSYEVSKVAIDLSDYAPISVYRVEYPYGKTPQSFSSYDYFGDILYLTGIEEDEQHKMTASKHAVIQYTTKHDAPTFTANGSFPRHLDEVVVKGAAAYCCLQRALYYEHQTSYTAGLSDDDLELAEAQIALAGVTAAEAYLALGDDYIALVNVAADVPGSYASYAQRSLEITNVYLNKSSVFINAASEHNAIAAQHSSLADKWRTEGTDRRNEFWAILTERSQLSGRAYVTVSPRQSGH